MHAHSPHNLTLLAYMQEVTKMRRDLLSARKPAGQPVVEIPAHGLKPEEVLTKLKGRAGFDQQVRGGQIDSDYVAYHFA